jgi:periplasmic protein TonB
MLFGSNKILIKMENNDFLKRDLDDIVFEGRNQTYGAYVIRRIYKNHLRRGAIFGFASFALLIAGPSIAENIKSKSKLEMSPIIELAKLPEDKPKVNIPPPPPPPKPEPIKKIETVRFVPPKVEEDNKVTEPENIPKMEEITAAVSTVTQEGVKGDLPPDMTPAPPPVGSGDGEVEVKKVEPKEEVLLFVEQAPEFANGLKAMYKFLGDNIKYPSVARENNIEGTVYVSFVVGKDGTIRDVKVKRGIAGGCNEEAIRVVELMPKWIPGKQNGKAVNVSFTIPIKFKLD